MISVKNVSLIVLSATLLLGCKPKNPNLYGQYEAPKPLPESPMPEVKNTEGAKPTSQPAPEGKKVQIPDPVPSIPEPTRYTQVDDEIFKPKLDVVVFMDTSATMTNDQDNLKRNIKNKFAKEFLKRRQLLDLHMGVVTAWDALSFRDVKTSQPLDMNCDLGQLRPLGGLGSKKRGDCRKIGNDVPFLTSETDVNLWGSTLSFGVEKFTRGSDGNVLPHSGPQHEQIFLPIMAALDPSNNDMNHNFRRQDAHLAVIIFTDTDDFDFINTEKDLLNMSVDTKTFMERDIKKMTMEERKKEEVSPEEIAHFLKSQEKENASVSVYAALGRYNDWIQTNGNTVGTYLQADYYIQEPGRGPRKIVDFMNLVDGMIFDLEDPNYGSKLAEMGDSMVKKSFRRVITLKYAPEIGNPKRPIIVRYGASQIIPKDDKTGWKLVPSKDEQGNSIVKIIISENSILNPEAGAKFSIEYTLLNAQTNVQ